MRRRNEKGEIFYVIAQNWLHESPDWKGSLNTQNKEWKRPIPRHIMIKF